MTPVIVYTYANCDSCRRATKWLRANRVDFEERPIRERPPTPAELRAMLAALQGERRRLFNTTGRDYQRLKLGEKLPAMADREALGLLAGNGNLVKRPFLLGPGIGLVGFAEPAWRDALVKK